MAPPARTSIVSLDMSKAFDTTNIHTLSRKLLRPKIPGAIIKFLKTTLRDAKPTQHIEITQFKTGVPQGGVLSPTLFNIYTAAIPPPRAPVEVKVYTDDITITSTHTSMSAAKKYIQPYLHKVLPGQNKTISHYIRTNNLHSVHPRPCRI